MTFIIVTANEFLATDAQTNRAINDTITMGLMDKDMCFGGYAKPPKTDPLSKRKHSATKREKKITILA